MKKITILLLIGISLVSVNPGFAHVKRSKIHGPAGSWTWGPNIPHIHEKGPEGFVDGNRSTRSSLNVFDIRNQANDKCLDAQQYGGPNGANVQLWTCNGKQWQKWYRGNNGELINQANGKCLDAQQYGGPNGANVQLWTCNGKQWQKWSAW